MQHLLECTAVCFHLSAVCPCLQAEVVASVETEELIRAFEEEKQRNDERLRELQRRREAEAQATAEATAREAEEKVGIGCRMWVLSDKLLHTTRCPYGWQHLHQSSSQSTTQHCALCLPAMQRLAAEAQAAAEAAAAEERLHALAALEAALPPEPRLEQAQQSVTCAVRLPNGQRISRRFLLSSPVQSLFAFVDAKGAGGVQGDYALVTQYPHRRILRPGTDDSHRADGDSSTTLQSFSFAPAGNELFLLEPLE